MTSKFSNESIKNLIAAGLLKIDKPGLILYNSPGQLESKRVTFRLIYLFEEFYSNLYFDTVNVLGKEDTDLLWYKIGKDVAMRYLLNFKGIKKDKKNLNNVINYFSKLISSMGIFSLEKIMLDVDRKKIAFRIKYSSITEKIKSSSYIEGIISAISSFVFERNIETKSYFKDGSEYMTIIADYSFARKHYQCKEIFKEITKRVSNFEKRKCLFSGLSSFLDFFKFKIIEADSNVIKLHGRTLMMQEVGVPSIFFYNYSKFGCEGLFERSILKTSEEISKELLASHNSVEKKIRVIRNIFSAIGLGETYFSVNKKKVIVDLLNPFFICGDPSFVHLFLNGVLNSIYSKQFILDSKSKTRFEYMSSNN